MAMQGRCTGGQKRGEEEYSSMYLGLCHIECFIKLIPDTFTVSLAAPMPSPVSGSLSLAALQRILAMSRR
jgi:hypothetical protein